MPDTPQTLQNHTRRDIPFMIAMLILLVNFLVVTWTAVRLDLVHFEAISLLWIAVAAALLVIGLKARSNALKAQDRVIRLEERLRYAAILPPSLQLAAGALSSRQIISLRFASDAELPALIERALAEHLEPKQIKQAIAAWKPDLDRV